MAGFGLPNFGQLTEAFKKAQEIQQNAQALQDELDGMEIEGQSTNADRPFTKTCSVPAAAADIATSVSSTR